MSLRNLLNNYMTIQTSKGANQNDDGSLDREAAWVEIKEFKNIKCHIQEKSKQTVVERYAKEEEEHNDLIYHTNKSLYDYVPSTAIRIIVNKANPNSKLSFPVNEEDIEIYEFMGSIEQVKGLRKRFKFFILRAERNDRWRN